MIFHVHMGIGMDAYEEIGSATGKLKCIYHNYEGRRVWRKSKAVIPPVYDQCQISRALGGCRLVWKMFVLIAYLVWFGLGNPGLIYPP